MDVRVCVMCEVFVCFCVLFLCLVQISVSVSKIVLHKLTKTILRKLICAFVLASINFVPKLRKCNKTVRKIDFSL